MGATQILICGESENTAKIHMSDEVANRIEPSVSRRRDARVVEEARLESV